MLGIPIYIPLWLDLKASSREILIERGYIYIPLWLDLKAIRRPEAFPLLLHLHSIMAGFKSRDSALVLDAGLGDDFFRYF